MAGKVGIGELQGQLLPQHSVGQTLANQLSRPRVRSLMDVGVSHTPGCYHHPAWSQSRVKFLTLRLWGPELRPPSFLSPSHHPLAPRVPSLRSCTASCTFCAHAGVGVGPVQALGTILAWCAGALIHIILAQVPAEACGQGRQDGYI